MEAMRVIQRQSKQAPGCASVCDIVNFVTENFTDDGDVEAQVRTALRQLCFQGFTKDEKDDEYRLIGPRACQVIKASNENSGHGQTKIRNHKPCRTDAQPRHENTCQSQDSSDIDLSIPSSTKEDIFRQKNCQDSVSGCKNESASGLAEDASVEQIRPPSNRCSTSQRSSSGRGEDEFAGGIEDLIKSSEICAAFEDDDDDDDKDYEVPDDPMDEDEDDEATSNDSVLQELSAGEEEASQEQARPRLRQRDEAHERELRRWVRNCRRECARRAEQQASQDDPEQQ